MAALGGFFVEVFERDMTTPGMPQDVQELPNYNADPVVDPTPAPAQLPPQDALQRQQQAMQMAQYQQALVAQRGQMAQQQAYVAQQQAQSDHASVMAEASRQAQSAVRQMVASGNWTQEQAEVTAAAHFNGKAQEFLRRQDQQQTVQQQKMYAVQRLSQVTGMAPAMLAGFNDFGSMVAAARQYMQTVGPQQQRLRQLEQYVQRLGQSQVPAQNYAQPGGGWGGGAQGIISAYARGGIPWSHQVRQAMQSMGIS